MNTFAVKEVFLTLQGEGVNTGRRAVFVRFSGCNLWSGRDTPEDRSKGRGACARWCDTDFFKGEAIGASELIARMESEWGGDSVHKFCVLTGGEPLLQLGDDAGVLFLVELTRRGWTVAVETNGTISRRPDAQIDWMCVSPKRGLVLAEGILEGANEVKVVLPGGVGVDRDWLPQELEWIEAKASGAALWVQPLDYDNPLQGVTRESTIRRCLDWVHSHPKWRLGTQVHKALGLR